MKDLFKNYILPTIYLFMCLFGVMYVAIYMLDKDVSTLIIGTITYVTGFILLIKNTIKDEAKD